MLPNETKRDSSQLNKFLLIDSGMQELSKNDIEFYSDESLLRIFLAITLYGQGGDSSGKN